MDALFSTPLFVSVIVFMGCLFLFIAGECSSRQRRNDGYYNRHESDRD